MIINEKPATFAPVAYIAHAPAPVPAPAPDTLRPSSPTPSLAILSTDLRRKEILYRQRMQQRFQRGFRGGKMRFAM